MAAAAAGEDISPCRRLSLLADNGDTAALTAELQRLQKKNGADEVARDIVTCDFGKRNSLSSLHGAALRGHTEILQVLLEAKAEPNATDDAGNTALHYAAELGHAEAVHMLLQQGADKLVRNNFGRSPTEKVTVNSWDSSACQMGKARIKHLFEGGTWEDLPPELCVKEQPKSKVAPPAPALAPWLGVAGEEGSVGGDLPQELPRFSPAALRASANRPVQVPAGQYASSEISTAATLQDVDIDTGHPPNLVELARCGNLPAVRSRLDEIRDQGGVRALIAEVSSIDGIHDTVRSAPSPLHAAAAAGHLEVLQLLLETRADPNIADDAGNTLLHAAAGMGNEEIVQELLKAGANPAWKNNFGRSPRAHAAPQTWDSEELQKRKARVRERLEGLASI